MATRGLNSLTSCRHYTVIRRGRERLGPFVVAMGCRYSELELEKLVLQTTSAGTML
jgi:hypothetical protein